MQLKLRHFIYIYQISCQYKSLFPQNHLRFGLTGSVYEFHNMVERMVRNIMSRGSRNPS